MIKNNIQRKNNNQEQHIPRKKIKNKYVIRNTGTSLSIADD
jgi:hypothetical protein